jgi:hypothetical protein
MSGPLMLVQIASGLGGRIAGDPEVLIHQVGSPERAVRGQTTFLAPPEFRDIPRVMLSAVRRSADLMERVRSLQKRIQTKEKGDG